MEYFSESCAMLDQNKNGECCDCCEEKPKDLMDCQEEIIAIMKAVKDIPGKGEKKVKLNNYFHSAI